MADSKNYLLEHNSKHITYWFLTASAHSPQAKQGFRKG